MNEYQSIHKIFLDIHEFIIDYTKLITTIHENSNEKNRNILTIKLDKQDFLLPATINEFSQTAHELQHCLKIHIRSLAQQRRNNISKGIDIDDDNVLINHEKELYQFNNDFKNHLEQLQMNVSDKNINKMIQYIQTIIDDFELYDDIQINKHSLNITFRLLPVLKHIQKQLCCISTNIQTILDDNTHIIEKHLRKLEQKINSYNIDMKNKLAKYISRDIRPPVLVIPCPINTYSPERSNQIKSSNIVINNKDSDQNSIQTTSTDSEDSLSTTENE
ncbi:unnamed protein product [Rotaria sp. Silwood2]|nr:unnamed protein product [Rotaria sp. Silwood2]CAF3230946.1 unnamed protein product [Rotaria sp. Silwood2]CAF4205206.1 unnamed protein product [Rotaria sp. Silwood2]CAF4713923.1 unnamed protein product [Rotaria sp. Silwood2]